MNDSRRKGCAWRRTSVKEIEEVDEFAIEATPQASSKAIDVPGHNPHPPSPIAQGGLYLLPVLLLS